MFVGDAPIGSQVKLEGNVAAVSIHVHAPSWVDVDEVRLWVNGVEESRHPLVFNNYKATVQTEVMVDKDSWIVAEAHGDASLFPIFAPVDQPPVLLGDALAAFAGPLGFGDDGLGDLAEDYLGPILPYGITNPIWLNVGDDDFEPPGALTRRCEDFGVVTEELARTLEPRALRSARPQVRHTFGLPKVRGDILDVRTIFDQFGRHQH